VTTHSSCFVGVKPHWPSSRSIVTPTLGSDREANTVQVVLVGGQDVNGPGCFFLFLAKNDNRNYNLQPEFKIEQSNYS